MEAVRPGIFVFAAVIGVTMRQAAWLAKATLGSPRPAGGAALFGCVIT
jgi:hypothetical protein